MSEARGKIEELKVTGRRLVKDLQELIHEGNVRRIVVKNEAGRTVLDLPIGLGLIGVAAAPVWAAIGTLVGLAKGFTLQVERAPEAPTPPPREPPPSP